MDYLVHQLNVNQPQYKEYSFTGPANVIYKSLIVNMCH